MQSQLLSRRWWAVGRALVASAALAAMVSGADQSATPATPAAVAGAADAQVSSRPWPELTASFECMTLALRSPQADVRHLFYEPQTGITMRVRVTVPEGWHVLELRDLAVTVAITETGEDLLAGPPLVPTGPDAWSHNDSDPFDFYASGRRQVGTIATLLCALPQKPAQVFAHLGAKATILITCEQDCLRQQLALSPGAEARSTLAGSDLRVALGGDNRATITSSMASYAMLARVCFVDAEQRKLISRGSSQSLGPGMSCSASFPQPAAAVQIEQYDRCRLGEVTLDLKNVPFASQGDGSQWKPFALTLARELDAPNLRSWASAKYAAQGASARPSHTLRQQLPLQSAAGMPATPTQPKSDF